MPDMESLKPKDHAEELAIFRSEIIGALTRRELDHGELRALLVEVASARYRPPRTARASTRCRRWSGGTTRTAQAGSTRFGPNRAATLVARAS